MKSSKLVCEKIKLLRKEASLSQEKLGKKLGCSQRLISNWELGQRRLTVDDLVKLAKVFQVSLDELVGNKK